MDDSQHIYTLSDINGFVRDIIDCELSDSFWVETEIAELSERSGHCYMTLVQKDENSHIPVARASARCWKNKWTMVKAHFETVANTPLQAGLKTLVLVHAQFHEAYGFSWIITDIDPTYTLGDLVRRRKEIIAQLKAEGVFNLNKQLAISPFAQRIAVISSASAAGYEDFMNQLSDNDSRLCFHTQLFEAVMQGEQVEESIISALTAVYESETPFDVVVIIRGGGSTVDLTGFDTLRLAEHVANFPLPVITGIGHERDESILDLVAHTSVKTPTAAAELLLDNLMATYTHIEELQRTVSLSIQHRLRDEHTRLKLLSGTLPHLVQQAVGRQQIYLQQLTGKVDNMAQQKTIRQQHHLTMLLQQIDTSLQRRLTSEKHRHALIQEKLKALDPQLLLKRGYSITLHEGHAVKDAKQLNAGNIITTRLAKGSVTSVVEKS